MSDGEKTANLTGASGAGWSEREKIAYLVVLCENEGKIDSKISNAPIPAGRSVIACRKLITRLKEKYKEDIMRIKNGQPLDGGTNGDTSEPLRTPKTPKTKRILTVFEETWDGTCTGICRDSWAVMMIIDSQWFYFLFQATLKQRQSVGK